MDGYYKDVKIPVIWASEFEKLFDGNNVVISDLSTQFVVGDMITFMLDIIYTT